MIARTALGSLALLVSLLAACGGDETAATTAGSGGASSASTSSSDVGGSGGSGAQGGSAPTSTTTSASSTGTGGEKPTATESEPNNGDPTNELAPGVVLSGALGEPGDIDVFEVATKPGAFYRVTLALPAGSTLVGHVTVIDTGRNGKAAGSDYAKLASTPSEGPLLTFPAFGVGGHYVAVRDARAIAKPSDPATGSATHTYTLKVEELVESDVVGEAAKFPGTIQDKLRFEGDLRAYPFDANAGADVLVKLTPSGEIYGRLWLLSKGTSDWYAGAEAASDGAVATIDAPLTEAGPSWVVVENIADVPVTNLDFSLNLSGN